MQRGRSGSNASALSSVQEVENFFLRANKLAPWKQGSTRTAGKGGQSLAVANMSAFENRDDRASMQQSTHMSYAGAGDFPELNQINA